MDHLRLASACDPISRVQAERIRAVLKARPETLAFVEMVFESCRDPRESVGRLAKRALAGKVDAAACPVKRLPEGLRRRGLRAA